MNARRKQQLIYLIADIISSELVWICFLGFRWMVYDGRVALLDDVLVPAFSFWRPLIVYPIVCVVVYYLSGYYLRPFQKPLWREFLRTFFAAIFISLLFFFVIVIDDPTENYRRYIVSLLVLFGLQFTLSYIPRLIITLLSRSIGVRQTHEVCSLEDVDKLDYDRILDIYKQRFANAADFEFYFVGDVDVDTLRPMLCKYLGALPTQKGHEKYRNISSRMRRGQYTCLFEKEQDTPNSLTLFLYHQKMKDNLRTSIQLSMLEQAMQMLYTETVREDEGGAYSVGVSASLRDYPEQQGIMQIVLPTAPDKRDRMMEVIEQGIKRICDEGPSEDNLQKIASDLQIEYQNVRNEEEVAGMIEAIKSGSSIRMEESEMVTYEDITYFLGMAMAALLIWELISLVLRRKM